MKHKVGDKVYFISMFIEPNILNTIKVGYGEITNINKKSYPYIYEIRYSKRNYTYMDFDSIYKTGEQLFDGLKKRKKLFLKMSSFISDIIDNNIPEQEFIERYENSIGAFKKEFI